MSEQTYISRYVHIRGRSICLNGEVIYESGLAATDFLVDVYRHFAINYPKFYKMDNLSRLAFLAAEILLDGIDLNAGYRPEDIAIVVSCANSSLDTDLRYWDTVAAGASPALFVYTLPNVMIGEICIRRSIKGENTCFVSDAFDAGFQTGYVNGLLAGGSAEVCLSGWADYVGGEMEAFFMLVEKKPSSLGIHNPIQIQNIYSRQWKN